MNYDHPCTECDDPCDCESEPCECCSNCYDEHGRVVRATSQHMRVRWQDLAPDDTDYPDDFEIVEDDDETLRTA